MKTIILPGYSPKNKDWAEEVADGLDLNHEVIVHNWKHWSSGSFSMPHELKKLVGEIGRDKVINVIAKSVGTRVVMSLPDDIIKRIEKLILCGIPTRFEGDTPRKLYAEGLRKFNSKGVVVFQNDKDPLANFSVVEKFIHSVNPKIEVNKKPRSDHHYPYTQEFKQSLLS